MITLRNTRSVCPSCFSTVAAQINERDGAVYMDKTCAEHGKSSLLLSRHPAYYKGLSDYYFPLMKEELRQRDYIVHLTNRCELDCPICLACANTPGIPEYPLDGLKGFLKGRRGCKIDLMGAEPTTRGDLPQIVRLVKASGNIPALHTNGMRIADYGYLTELKKAGLREVHLQLDGFDDRVYEKIRGRGLLRIKMRALENLEKAGIAADLVVTVVRGVNEQEMIKVLEFALSHAFVKEVFFLGCRSLGKARKLPPESCYMPDELIDILEEQTEGRIARKEIFEFQKLYFALLSAFSLRKCFYIQHFLVGREKGGGFSGVDKFFDLGRIQHALDAFREMRMAGRRYAVPYLLASLARELIKSPGSFWRQELFSYGVPFISGFNLSRLPRRSVLLGFISACDAYSFDEDIARGCGKGAFSPEMGVQDSGAANNIALDKLRSGRPYA